VLTFAVFQSEFTKRPDIDEKVFNSRYAYNIRHNYGKEGKRMNYSAYGCPKVINTIPSANETCGCPFRSSKADELMQDFQGAGIGPVGAAELIKLVEGMHFQIACKKYFDLTHPSNKWDDTGVTHPNT
jgi:DNA primase large subunit